MECDLSARERLGKQNFCKLPVVNLAVRVNVGELEGLIDFFLSEGITEGDEDVSELLRVNFAGVVLVKNLESVEDGLLLLLKRLPTSGQNLNAKIEWEENVRMWQYRDARLRGRRCRRSHCPCRWTSCSP